MVGPGSAGLQPRQARVGTGEGTGIKDTGVCERCLGAPGCDGLGSSEAQRLAGRVKKGKGQDREWEEVTPEGESFTHTPCTPAPAGRTHAHTLLQPCVSNRDREHAGPSCTSGAILVTEAHTNPMACTAQVPKAPTHWLPFCWCLQAPFPTRGSGTSELKRGAGHGLQQGTGWGAQRWGRGEGRPGGEPHCGGAVCRAWASLASASAAGPPSFPDPSRGAATAQAPEMATEEGRRAETPGLAAQSGQGLGLRPAAFLPTAPAADSR